MLTMLLVFILLVFILVVLWVQHWERRVVRLSTERNRWKVMVDDVVFALKPVVDLMHTDDSSIVDRVRETVKDVQRERASVADAARDLGPRTLTEGHSDAVRVAEFMAKVRNAAVAQGVGEDVPLWVWVSWLIGEMKQIKTELEPILPLPKVHEGGALAERVRDLVSEVEDERAIAALTDARINELTQQLESLRAGLHGPNAELESLQVLAWDALTERASVVQSLSDLRAFVEQSVPASGDRMKTIATTLDVAVRRLNGHPWPDLVARRDRDIQNSPIGNFGVQVFDQVVLRDPVPTLGPIDPKIIG